MRLIDADRAELYDAIGRNAFRDRQDIIDLINLQPRVNAVPVVYGRWLCADDFVICSQCEAEMNQKNSLGVDNPKNYCPNCGADMLNGG